MVRLLSQWQYGPGDPKTSKTTLRRDVLENEGEWRRTGHISFYLMRGYAR